jgi:hypothetical protein
MTDLILSETNTDLIFSVQGTEATNFEPLNQFVAFIREQAENQAKGLTANTKEEREKLKSIAFAVTKSRTHIEKITKTMADELKEMPKLLDKKRKKFTDDVTEIFESVRRPLTLWEEAEEAKKQEIIRLEQEAIQKEKEAAAQELARLQEIERIAQQAAREKEIAEQAALKAKQEAEYAAAETIRLANEATARAERLALQAKLDAEKAAADAVAAERAAIEKAKQEAEKIANNEKHRNDIECAVFDALTKIGVETELANRVLSALINGELPNVKIVY